jgi:hypothetical protein
MISATLYQDGTGFSGCRIKGHSGYGEAGSDIVCAAVSILSCTCVNALESVCGVVPETEANEEGLLSFRLPERTGEQNEKAQVLMAALKQGLEDLAESYPRNVRLLIRNGGKGQ